MYIPRILSSGSGALNHKFTLICSVKMKKIVHNQLGGTRTSYSVSHTSDMTVSALQSGRGCAPPAHSPRPLLSRLSLGELDRTAASAAARVPAGSRGERREARGERRVPIPGPTRTRLRTTSPCGRRPPRSPSGQKDGLGLSHRSMLLDLMDVPQQLTARHSTHACCSCSYHPIR